MKSTQQHIADLEQRRTAIRTSAAGRWLTAAEREQVKLLTAALSAAWEMRRMERARQPRAEHEIIVVGKLKEATR